MTIGRARGILSLLWIFLCTPLILLIEGMSIMGRFKENWDAPWTWISPLIFPIISLIISVWSVGEQPSQKKEVKSLYVFSCTLFLSVAYLLSIYAVLLVQPITGAPIYEEMRNSGWFLGLVQGLVTAAIGKFFIENSD